MLKSMWLDTDLRAGMIMHDYTCGVYNILALLAVQSWKPRQKCVPLAGNILGLHR